MFFWVVIAALIIWLCLVCGTFYAWRRSYLGGITTAGTVWLLSLVAVIIVLCFGPYWEVMYRTVLQPG